MLEDINGAREIVVFAVYNINVYDHPSFSISDDENYYFSTANFCS